jgi:riboflavin biosynthesis pyrimidine reductase
VKPHVICHMVASLDGRTLISRWQPLDASRRAQFAELHERLAVDAWLVGRVTGAEYAKAGAYPALAGETYPREPWFARRDAVAYGVVLDAQGKIAWGRADIEGDPIVVVLSEQVSDSHLAGLRRDGVSYLFAGKDELDLALALESLNRELGIKRLEINGGGITNGAFLHAGLIDEISLAIYPAVDGAKGASSIFDSTDGDPDAPAPVAAMALESSEVLAGGAVWLRYRLRAGRNTAYDHENGTAAQ